jgi:flavin-dependent dehydrogenase
LDLCAQAPGAGCDLTRCRPESFDAIIIGAGLAGSTFAFFRARAGVSVLLLDRARFRRDKPHGGDYPVGGQPPPFSLEPVVEDVFDRFELGLFYSG